MVGGNMIFSLFRRFQGRSHRKFVEQCKPVVQKICALEEHYRSLTDEQLQAKTQEFMQRFQAGEQLDALLPEAFAVVKNAARRLCGKELLVCDHHIPWQMVHHDVQLIGGIAMHQGAIAEMGTGEGKTLVAGLPLYLNALTGKNVQLVTVNDYLARRDSEWMGYLYRFLGLSVGCIQNDMESDERRLAYACNITYVTASELGFDYLRDNGMAMRNEDQVQRHYAYAIVDEADSVLIDEARTPLIISGPAQDDGGKLFMELRDSVRRLVTLQVELCNDLITTALEGIHSENKAIQYAGLVALLQVRMGMPRNRQLMKVMENGAIRRRFEKFALEMHSDFNKEELYRYKEHLFFEIDEKQREADLTEKGRKRLCPGDDQAFLLPDLPLIFSQLDGRKDLTDEERHRQKESAEVVFAQESARIHALSQLLRAYCLYEQDVDYVIQDNKVLIVDENTGRVMPGRRWSEGLHQAVEAKEGVKIEHETKTYATITLQNFFRLYDKLAGMTGTAETEASEFFDIYKLPVRVIPPNKPCRRKEFNDSIFKTRLGKYKAVIRDIEAAHKKGQPVLAGTASVEASEVVSRMLKGAKIPHQVLNAKHHEQEAEIISLAGQSGAVTISTNMAGRGTDIRLAPEVVPMGLLVLGTERHEARRIDRQLQGRCGRQGDLGEAKFYVSLEDDLMRHFADAGPIARLLEKSFGEDEELEHPMLNRSIASAQKKVEQLHYLMRRRLLQYDDVLSRQRQIIYALRNEALHSETPKDLIFEFILETLEERLGLESSGRSSPEALEIGGFITWVNHTFPVALHLDELQGKTPQAIGDHVFEKIKQAYAERENLDDAAFLRSVERHIIVRNIDHHWQTHLTEMEELRRSVSLRSYGQKDPLNEYKSEAFAYFNALMREIRNAIAVEGLRFTHLNAPEALFSRMVKRAKAVHPGVSPEGVEVSIPDIQIIIPKPQGPHAGRNDLCPCGSGLKYKKCCGKSG